MSGLIACHNMYHLIIEPFEAHGILYNNVSILVLPIPGMIPLLAASSI